MSMYMLILYSPLLHATHYIFYLGLASALQFHSDITARNTTRNAYITQFGTTNPHVYRSALQQLVYTLDTSVGGTWHNILIHTHRVLAEELLRLHDWHAARYECELAYRMSSVLNGKDGAMTIEIRKYMETIITIPTKEQWQKTQRQQQQQQQVQSTSTFPIPVNTSTRPRPPMPQTYGKIEVLPDDDDNNISTTTSTSTSSSSSTSTFTSTSPPLCVVCHAPSLSRVHCSVCSRSYCSSVHRRWDASVQHPPRTCAASH